MRVVQKWVDLAKFSQGEDDSPHPRKKDTQKVSDEISRGLLASVLPIRQGRPHHSVPPQMPTHSPSPGEAQLRQPHWPRSPPGALRPRRHSAETTPSITRRCGRPCPHGKRKGCSGFCGGRRRWQQKGSISRSGTRRWRWGGCLTPFPRLKASSAAWGQATLWPALPKLS